MTSSITDLAKLKEHLTVIESAEAYMIGCCGCPGSDDTHDAECVANLRRALDYAQDEILSTLAVVAHDLRVQAELVELKATVAQLVTNERVREQERITAERAANYRASGRLR